MSEFHASPSAIQAVLFDLDGTLADTAPDLCGAINRMRASRDLAPLPLSRLRPFASQGARGLLAAGFDVTSDHPEFGVMREEFFATYAAHLCEETRLFASMEETITLLQRSGIPWGIVTNKPHRFTDPLVERLVLLKSAGVVVSGDTTAHAKPHPEPFLHAARILGIAPVRCLAIGDDERDIVAGQAAGMMTIAAAWGYCADSDPRTWNADATLENPAQLVTLLRNRLRAGQMSRAEVGTRRD